MRALEQAWVDALDEDTRAIAGDGVVDLDAEEAQCPACGADFDPKVGRCPDCGLYLGGGAADED